jgi:hypothetical protein
MKVSDIVDDVLLRIADPAGKRFFSPVQVERAMNRVYRKINEETRCIEKEWEIDAGSPGVGDSVDDGYFALPSDWLYPYRVEDSAGYNYEYVPKEVFAKEESAYRFTIELGRIYFTNVSSDSVFTVKYYSAGQELSIKADGGLVTGQINEPEYPDHLQDILLYGTAIHLSAEYPLYQNDAIEYHDYVLKIKRRHRFVDFSTPKTTGPRPYSTTTDMYGHEQVRYR